MSSRLENNKVALRYARALFDSTQAGGETDAVATDLQQVSDLVVASADLQTFFENPGIPQADKLQFVDQQFGALNSWVLRLLKLMVENGRVAAVPQVAHNLKDLINKRDNVTEAEIITAVELDDELKGRVQKTLQNTLGYSRVEITNRVEPGILGGVIIKVEDRVIDGSYVGRLEDLRKQVGAL